MSRQIIMGEIISIFLETLRGKSLTRTLINLRSREIYLTGNGTDLGSKDASSSHFRFLHTDGKIQHVDIDPGHDSVESMDLEHPFFIQEASKDFVLCFNVLEHLFDYNNCIEESLRILQPGGVFVGATPFLYHIHPDPDDHFRYTGSTLVRLLDQAGFVSIHVEPLGRGPFTAAAQMILPWMRFRLLMAACIGFTLLLDKIASTVFRKNWTEIYPLAYFFTAEKPPMKK